MNVFYELFENLPRGGPGSDQCTEKAFGKLKGLPANPKILDIGCGVGSQTLALARCTSGFITAMDNHQPFLDKLSNRANKAELAHRIKPVNGSMFKLEFESESFDVIWSEGAIYIMGFEDGLNAWKNVLKPGGYIAVSELSWFKPDPPEKLKDFWDRDYPGMKSLEENMEIIKKCGYTDISHFNLPDSVWWDSFYNPMEEQIMTLQQKYAEDPEALETLMTQALEINLFQKYSDWYGYVFYIMQKGE
jgi:ubiquinone/menaquinone biosynthesis C-methylase UbiE